MNLSTKSKIFTGFKTEEQLVEVVLSFIKKSAGFGYKAELELDGGVGIADIVLYKRHPRTTRELQKLASVPPRLAPLLDPLTAAYISTCDDLANSLGLSSSAALRLIKQLQRLGLWTAHPSKSALASVRLPPFQTIVAVEAKLADWSRALGQAYRNRQFADESWVVLDHRFHRPAVAQLERFIRSGVGLASMDLNGDLYVHHRATATPAMSLTKRWHAQAALARRVAK